MAENLEERIALRLSARLKQAFEEKARETGIHPSTLLRGLIQAFVKGEIELRLGGARNE